MPQTYPVTYVSYFSVKLGWEDVLFPARARAGYFPASQVLDAGSRDPGDGDHHPPEGPFSGITVHVSSEAFDGLAHQEGPVGIPGSCLTKGKERRNKCSGAGEGLG